MNKNLAWVLIAFFAIIIIIGLILYYHQPELKASGPLNCNAILENGKPEDKVNIVFFFDNVDEKEANNYINYILSVEPFNSSKEKFNFYSLNAIPSCSIQNGIMICYSNQLVRESASCPNNYLVVLSKQSSSVRSSAYINLISININSQKSVLIHEFGHIFANLADEYVPSTIPRGSKNCVSSCDSFKTETDGCFQGCSQDSYFRPVDAGVMRTLSTNQYGKYDEKIVEDNLNKYG